MGGPPRPPPSRTVAAAGTRGYSRLPAYHTHVTLWEYAEFEVNQDEVLTWIGSDGLRSPVQDRPSRIAYLCERAAEGWELVAVTAENADRTYTLRRPRP